MWLEVNAIQDTIAESSSRHRRSAEQRSKRAWMFGKWVDTNVGSSGGYDNVEPPRESGNYGGGSSYGSPTPPPASGYDAPVVNPEPAIQQCTCEFFIL